MNLLCVRQRPTVCVTCVWAGVDSVREQGKLEARKMPENAAESHTSGARGVGQFLAITEHAHKGLAVFHNMLF